MLHDEAPQPTGRTAPVASDPATPEAAGSPWYDQMEYRFPMEVRPGESDSVFDRFIITTPGGSVTGSVVNGAAMYPPGPNAATLGDLKVASAYGGEGRGTELVRAFAAEAGRRGATRVSSTIHSPTALRNRVRIFGADKLQFTDPQDRDEGLTVEVAVARLETFAQ